jgi:hypothetical protein
LGLALVLITKRAAAAAAAAASAAKLARPSTCRSSHSLSLLDAAAAAALLPAPERLRFSTGPDARAPLLLLEFAPPARARFFFWFFVLLLGRLAGGLDAMAAYII